MDEEKIDQLMRSLVQRYVQKADNFLQEMRQKFCNELQEMCQKLCNVLQEIRPIGTETSFH